MNEWVNKMNELQEQHKKRRAEWLASVPHVDELLALQLQGTIPKQMPGDVQTNGYLRDIAQKSRRELDKARYILERQAKAGVVTIPYYADEYPRHFCGLGDDAPPLIHVLGNRELLNREDNVTIIGSRAADRDGLAAASRMAEQIGGAGHVVISGLAEEIERIFLVKTSSYKGNPVHYAIEVESAKDRIEVRNLLISCLLEQNRAILRRVTEIKLNTIAELSTERLSEFFELQQCGIVVVSLYKSFDRGDSLNDMHRAMDDLVAQIKGVKRDVLFVFEFSKAAEPSWKYIKSSLKEINFIELKEKNLSNAESRNFIDKLAAIDYHYDPKLNQFI